MSSISTAEAAFAPAEAAFAGDVIDGDDVGFATEEGVLPGPGVVRTGGGGTTGDVVSTTDDGDLLF